MVMWLLNVYQLKGRQNCTLSRQIIIIFSLRIIISCSSLEAVLKNNVSVFDYIVTYGPEVI